MDQTASADQSLLRYERERCEDTGVDRHQRLRARGHRQERTWDRTVPARNLANPQRDVVRENPYFSSIEREKKRECRTPISITNCRRLTYSRTVVSRPRLSA